MPTAAAQPNPIMSLMPMIVIFAIIYFLIIRPQQKQAKEHRLMVNNLKNGDRVLTQGGIYGTVAAVKGEIIVLKIAENVKVEVSRTGISQVIPDTASAAKPVEPEVVS